VAAVSLAIEVDGMVVGTHCWYLTTAGLGNQLHMFDIADLSSCPPSLKVYVLDSSLSGLALMEEAIKWRQASYEVTIICTGVKRRLYEHGTVAFSLGQGIARHCLLAGCRTWRSFRL